MKSSGKTRKRDYSPFIDPKKNNNNNKPTKN